MAAPTHLLYLHGFRSSPLSFKAQRLGRWMAEHRPDIVWHCPQLPPSPAEAVEGLLRTVAGWGIDAATDLAVVGSSLGGLYATVLVGASMPRPTWRWWAAAWAASTPRCWRPVWAAAAW